MPEEKKSTEKKAEKKSAPKAKKEKKVEKKKKPVKTELPKIRPGYLVKVSHLSPDQKRNFITQGVVLRVRGEGENKTFTVRRTSQGVGVEKVFSFASPALKSLEVIKERSAKRARLYYLRQKDLKKSIKSKYLAN